MMRSTRIDLAVHAAVVRIAMFATAQQAVAQDVDRLSNVDPLSVMPETMVAPPRDLPGHDPMPLEPPSEVEEAAATVEREWFGHLPWTEWSRITGDWKGWRDSLFDTGIDFNASYTGDYSYVFDGGINRGGSYRHLIDVNLTFDLDTIFDIAGGSVFVDFYSINGDNASKDAGDWQWLDNISTDFSVDQIAEVWYEQWLMDERLRIKVGKIDAGMEFAVPVAGYEFMNSSAAYSPTIFAMPSYPDPSTGIMALAHPAEWLYVGGGAFDGAATVDGVRTGSRGPSGFFGDSDGSDDYFFIGEAGAQWESLGGMHGGRIAGGAWHHTGEFDRFDGGTDDGTSGVYLLAEQTMWRPAGAADDDERGLSAFAQYGWADGDVSEVEQHLAAGLGLHGTFAGRDADFAGVYVTWIDLSDAVDAGLDEDETAIELLYKFQVTAAVSVKTDLQYIINPYGDPTVDNALVGALRVEITF